MNEQNIYYFSDQGNIFSDQNRKFRFTFQELHYILNYHFLKISDNHKIIIEIFFSTYKSQNDQNFQSIETNLETKSIFVKLKIEFVQKLETQNIN